MNIITAEPLDCCRRECNGDCRFSCVQTLITEARPTEVSDSFLHTETPPLQVIELGTCRLSPPDNRAPNMEERGTSLTNTSKPELGKDISRKFTPREILHHNNLVGWNEWVISKGKVYDMTKLKEVVSQLIEAARKDRTSELERKKVSEENKVSNYQQNGDSYIGLDDKCFNSFCSICVYDNEAKFDDIALLSRDKMIQLLDPAKMEDRTNSWCVGCVVERDSLYWDKIRSDVKDLLNDLIREDCHDTLSEYQLEYMNLLQRWIKKYKNQDPEHYIHFEYDPNLSIFPLPEDIKESPECLRSWVENWQRFDFKLPQSGAWDPPEFECIDIGNCHEVFLSTLRSSIELSPLDTTIEGETAWEVIDECLFADDVMTDHQKAIEHERKNRHNFFDSQRMEKRRHRILQYFIFKYRFDEVNVAHFLNWSSEMKNGEDRFMNLCKNS